MSLSEDRTPHVLGDLGLEITEAGDTLHGRGDVLATMWAPGSDTLRPSILATWADTILGLLAVRAIAPRIPVTLELDVHLFEPVSGTPALTATGRVTKAGRAVLVCTVEFATAAGNQVGFGHCLFMAAPDPELTMPTGSWALERFSSRRAQLTEPFAQRAGCERIEPGVAVLPCGPHVLNGAKTLNGGLVAIAVEEAALSADPSGRPITSMQLRYLRPVRTGPAEARARMRAGLGEVEVRDQSNNSLAILATTRATTP